METHPGLLGARSKPGSGQQCSPRAGPRALLWPRMLNVPSRPLPPPALGARAPPLQPQTKACCSDLLSRSRGRGPLCFSQMRAGSKREGRAPKITRQHGKARPSSPSRPPSAEAAEVQKLSRGCARTQREFPLVPAILPSSLSLFPLLLLPPQNVLADRELYRHLLQRFQTGDSRVRMCCIWPSHCLRTI